ncbi:hypothetical protein BsWGS_18423 [Bradybaena similaris]
MLVRLTLAYLLALLPGKDVYGTPCSPGWFGVACMFKCNCASLQMCNTDVKCRNSDSCKIGFFGPYCQYVDLVSRHSTNGTKNYLKDGDNSTCNPDPNATDIQVTLDAMFKFTWLRIHFNDNNELHTFVVEFNDPAVPCSNARAFTISDLTMDVTCDVEIKVNKIAIYGSISPYVCSIYISGGRNVAIKQSTWQSSSFNIITSNSWNAVDGNNSARNDDNSCAKTGNTEFPEWRLTYNQLYSIYYIIIYNRDVIEHRLNTFLLETLDSVNRTVFNFSDTSVRPLAIYNISHDEVTPVKSLRIVQLSSAKKTDRIITICEVETFGDVVCEPNTFGLLCENACNCSSTDVCNQHTGLCSEGCPSGYYGRECSLLCSEHCLLRNCAVDTGVCISCPPGYTGDTCTTECPDGTYGQDCSYNCSEFCTGPCNNTNGRCACTGNFGGSSCADCVQGYFGSHCQMLCPPQCQVCERHTGLCLKCLGARLMPTCQGCPPALYGAGCDFHCPINCVRGLCDSASGRCKACKPTFYGLWCKYACPMRCLNGACHIETGDCFSCQKGFTGLMCDIAIKENSIDWSTLFMLTFSLGVCTLFIVSVLRQKGTQHRQKKSPVDCVRVETDESPAQEE